MLTPEWLTQVLRDNGHEVVAVALDITHTHQTVVSTIHHLAVQYAETADVPTSLILKIPNAEFHAKYDNSVNREVLFYGQLVPIMQCGGVDTSFLIPCLEAAFDDQDKPASLLLHDVSTTHFSLEVEQSPTVAHYEQIVDGFAVLHAFWWQHPRLGQDIGQRLTAADITTFEQSARRKLVEYADFWGSSLPDGWHLLSPAVDHWPPRRYKRVVNGVGLTLVHRDAHPNNFLYPRASGVVKFIDWDAWRVDTGTDDIAYILAFHTAPEQRNLTEMDLLRRYHRRLLDHGVQNYSWDDCWYDYRASIIRCLSFLVNAGNPGQWKRPMWWPRIQRGLRAYTDLNCASILS
jgi:thiamine kinase-like enzyme